MANEKKNNVTAESYAYEEPGGPYWNAVSFQFMYAPAFQFQHLPGVKNYRYDLTDANGKRHTFPATSAKASLAPIWEDVPEGVAHLTVTALTDDGKDYALVGARTFFRLAPFSDDLPGPARPYGEAAKMVYEYTIDAPFIRHWLTDGTPDPNYPLYVYPSKMIAALVDGMIIYSSLVPERADEALTIAKNAADYLLGLTPGEGSPIAGLPLTYYINFRPDPEKQYNLSAGPRLHTVMMIYPAVVGTAYLHLADATGEQRYTGAAMKIAAWYRDHIEENGSWPLVISTETGETIVKNPCYPLEQITPFITMIYERTGDAVWKSIIDRNMKYLEQHVIPQFNWEAQFEDSFVSESYSNLTHYGATAFIRHCLKYEADNEERMKYVDKLMRFVEDQFVIWKKPSPWNTKGFDTSIWITPCGLEQYAWHLPIDASTSDILLTFLAMYEAGKGEIYLEKAKALANTLTRVQYPDGYIPTHWVNEDFLKEGSTATWLNCMYLSAKALATLAKATEI